MLNSAEMKIFLLINVKMPTIEGILTFMSREKNILSFSEPKNADFSWYFYTYEHLKFHAQLRWAWKKSYNLGLWIEELCKLLFKKEYLHRHLFQQFFKGEKFSLLSVCLTWERTLATGGSATQEKNLLTQEQIIALKSWEHNKVNDGVGFLE